MDPTSDLYQMVMRLANDDLIDHATWCNALAYLSGDYKPINHRLCQLSFFRCLEAHKESHGHLQLA